MYKIWVFSKSHCKQFFLVKLTWNPLSAPRWNKESQRKMIFQKAVATTGRSGLVS